MRVFLSYASEDRKEAQLIAESIRARGHEVFFDKENLPAGQSYEDLIEDAIGNAALFVFLISPDAVRAGKFTLTELGIAKRKWKSAKGHVLPVLLWPTPIEDVPAYLRAVSILEPEGNVPAEVATAVQALSWHWSRIVRRGATVMLALSTIGGAIWYFTPATPSFSVETQAPKAEQKGFFGKPDMYKVAYKATNRGGVAGQMSGATLEVDPPQALKRQGSPADELHPIAPGASYEGAFLLSVSDHAARFRVCVQTLETKQTCSPWQDWLSQGQFPFQQVVAIDEALAIEARAAAWEGSAFLVAARSPNRIVRLNEEGLSLAEGALPGTPTAMSIGPLGLFVGLTAPDEIIKLDPDTFDILGRYSLSFPDDLDAWGEPVSTRPASMAQDGTRLWVLTRGGASSSGLVYVDGDPEAPTVPPYYKEVSFDLSDMRLRDGTDAVWSGQDSTTPTAIHRFQANAYTEFGGHDYEIASCASDLAAGGGRILYVPDCDGVLQTVEVGNGRLHLQDSVARILDYQSTVDSWERVLLGETPGGGYIGVLSQRTSGPRVVPEIHRIAVSALDQSLGSRKIFALDGAKVLDMAVGSKTALLFLESDEGERQLVQSRYR